MTVQISFKYELALRTSRKQNCRVHATAIEHVEMFPAIS